ncbi:hypothetical protein L207DRAFT_467194 [Hyaloscypha variabilis F]|uniref:Uncharacterized protein n=1 Tax=Hyaloscypha variabilis (strain UAMH 11265 / GT02V1 / F) TaxID=1149755 RepID=A0A2J6R7P8_HYAVF|nr:hypothetical protein L207DRAFT_467194 [Hyaloscypha variabilis F]
MVIAGLAQKCRREHRNEAGWRSEVEFKLFERFNFEVACKKCRRRLWRSETESSPAASNSRTTSLAERQQKREPCKCSPSGRLEDCHDSGLSNLFSARIQEAVCQLGEVDADTPNPKKEPDRIHGLRRTTIFENLLEKTYSHEDSTVSRSRSLEEFLQLSIHPDNGGDPLLFPFLIFEAKGGMGAESFMHMEIQTAFPIKHALKLQYDLLKTRGNTMDVPGGPLVWFLANHGENWRVYAAFVYEEEDRPNYLIQRLWSGAVDGQDAAMQLVLIVDYILDWARDIYRPNIIRQLKTLSSSNINDAMTLDFDPDVYSLAGRVQPWMEAVETQTLELMPDDTPSPHYDEATATQGDDESDPFALFNTPHGLVRDGRCIVSRIRALFLTADNTRTFFEDFDNPKKAMTFARSIIAVLSRRCAALDSVEVLDSIAEKWTGTEPRRARLAEQNSTVYAQFRLSYYLNYDWDQVRELTYLAVSEDAREILMEVADYRVFPRRRYQFSPPRCSTESVLETIDRLLRHSVQQDLEYALKRRTFMFDMKSTGRFPPRDPDDTLSDFDDFMPNSLTAIFKTVLKRDKDTKSPGVTMQQLVHTVYEKYRIVKREPSEPFIRISSRLDREGRTLYGAGDGPSERRYKRKKFGKMLVYADVENAKFLPTASDQKLCLFVLDGEAVKPNKFACILLTCMNRDRIYSTVRKGGAQRARDVRTDNRQRCVYTMDDLEESLLLTSFALGRKILEWGIEVLSSQSKGESILEILRKLLRTYSEVELS